MLRTLHRTLPPREARELMLLVVWLTAAAALQGLVLGLVGVVVAALCAGTSVWSTIIALGIALIAFLGVQWVAQMIAFRVGSETARALHLTLGDHLAELPLGWFTPQRTAQVIDLATAGVPQLMSYSAILLRPALTAFVTPIAAALTLALLDVRFTLAVLLGVGVAWVASRVAAHLTEGVDARNHAAQTEANRRILEYADRQAVIRTDQRTADAGALEESFVRLQDAAKQAAGAVIPGLLLFGVVLNMLFAAVIAWGIAAVSGATMTVPTMLGVIVVVARLTAVASAGAELSAGLRMQRGTLDRLRTVLDTEPLPRVESRPAVLGEDDVVIVENVSFSYGADTVLHDISLSLPRTGLVALIGPSGAGKSTLLQLLARFWDPSTGRILWEDGDLRALDGVDGRIGTVLQDDYLLEGTVAENIRLGKPDATMPEIVQAAEAAGLAPLLADRAEGVDLPVGPGGKLLSGGERQRVCVARALLKAAPLTLIDEATSALDPVNARIVADAAYRLSRTGSVLVIAHNLDTIVRADLVIVLDQGRIVQRGSYAELAGQPGLFRELLARGV